LNIHCTFVYMPIFSRIFLSNYWWQKSDIWSQASYRYPISYWTLPVLTVDDRKQCRAHKRYVSTSVAPHRYPYCGIKNLKNYVHNNCLNSFHWR
jgi:hypothetical protein